MDMTSRHRPLTVRAALVATCALVGCGTPQPARDLASQGAAMTERSESESLAFIHRAEQAFERRAYVVRRLAEGEIVDKVGGEFRAWVDTEAGIPSRQASIDQVKRIADRSRTMREQIQTAQAAKVKQLLDAAGAEVKPPSAALSEGKKAFVVLSQELSAQEWLALSQAYVQQVRRDLKALNAPAPAASAAGTP